MKTKLQRIKRREQLELLRYAGWIFLFFALVAVAEILASK